jgi:glycosyltransferase involved in cell wall biosynthesis
VYVDDVYRVARVDGERRVTTDRAFLLFACEVGSHFDRLLLLGRAVEDGTAADYALPPRAELVPLPHYPSLADGRAVARSVRGSLRAFWRAAGEADVVWAFGPHPMQLLLVACALARRTPVVLGVRQDTIAYFRARGAARAPVAGAVRVLDAAHRLVARRVPATVVGEGLAVRLGPRAIPFTVSLVRAASIAAEPRMPSGDGRVRLLTVGRLEPEKSPQVLVEALALLERREPGRYALDWVGRGGLEAEVEEALAQAGLARVARLRGYVPFGEELLALYRNADVFVHVALTEGVPQVVVEALASGTPVVATAVGGVPAATGEEEAARLVPPGDATALADAIAATAHDREGTRRRAEAGLARARRWSMEAEAARVAAVLGAVSHGRDPRDLAGGAAPSAAPAPARRRSRWAATSRR